MIYTFYNSAAMSKKADVLLNAKKSTGLYTAPPDGVNVTLILAESNPAYVVDKVAAAVNETVSLIAQFDCEKVGTVRIVVGYLKNM